MSANPNAGSRAKRWHLAPILLASLGLAACAESPGAGSGPNGTEVTSSAEPIGPEDDEAPEVFHVAEPGLWDGRPSLGGIWVAHPDVNEPERVRIANADNGQTVIGALFRRERDLPGPALQVSSDAATVLGMLPGAPANLEVTALRRDSADAPSDPADGGEAQDTTSDAGTPGAPEPDDAPARRAMPVQPAAQAAADPHLEAR
ncbi:hypothetical protein [Rubellimicrobium arenae]|uniref:hypothetical protein n=1 Tax=Rubellimicrobium arenae TaxID=2817372 RepID=UPI001B30A0CB|nr:hypothetical protein [Rubellimicrobium arenae]